MKQKLQSLRVLASRRLALAVASTVGIVQAAHADLPAGVSSTITEIGNNATALFNAVFVVVASVVGMVVVIRLFKKFANKI